MYFNQLVYALKSDGKLGSLHGFFNINISDDKNQITMTRRNTRFTTITKILIEGDKADFDHIYGTLHMTVVYENCETQVTYYDVNDEDDIEGMLELLTINLTSPFK